MTPLGAQTKTQARLEYGLVDVGAKADASLLVTDQESWVNIETIHRDDKTYPAYATFEGGGFVLDGSVDFFPDDPKAEEMGWWTQTLSDLNGSFAVKPILQVGFAAPHTSGGITLWFSERTEEWASAVTITWLDSTSTEMDTKTFYPNRGQCYCENLIENYQGLILVFHGTNLPYHRLKLSAIEYGTIIDFVEGGDELIHAEILAQVDLLSDVVSVNTLDFRFHSAGNTFDLLNPTGAHVLFQQKQWVKAGVTIDGALQQLGTYYLVQPEVTDNITSMNCEDMLGVIDRTDFDGGRWDGIASADLIALIMESAKVTDYVLEKSLAQVKLIGTLAVMTHREALQQVAFAMMATVQCKRDGRIHIAPLPTLVSNTVDPYNKAAGQSVKQADLVTGVEVYHGTTSEGTLLGKRFASNLPAQAKDNITRVYLTLYGDGQALADHIYNVLQLRLTASGDWFPTTIAAGDLVDVQQSSGNTLRGFVTTFDMQLTDGFRARTEVVGNAKAKFNL